MDINNEFTEWAVARGVQLNGIATHRFPGRGLGIIAKQELKVCRTGHYLYLITLYFSFALSITTVSASAF